MSTITLTELYSLLTEKVGKETAQSLTSYIESKIEKEVEALEYLDFPCELVKEIPLPIKDKGKESTENYISIEKKVLAAIKYKNQAQFNPCLYAEGLANKIEERKGKIAMNILYILHSNA